MSKKLVSIITPSYNCEEYIEETIQSVLSQTYSNWEMLIVDDCSTDRSCSIINKYCSLDSRIKLFILNTNSGPAVARNLAITKAKGTFLAFLDSDDIWTINKLKTQLQFMQENHSSFSFTAYQYLSKTGKINPHIIHVPSTITYSGLLKETVIACLSVIYNASELGKSYFDTSLNKHEDYQYWLEILKTINKADGLDEPLSYYRVRENSLSGNKISAASYVWKIQRQYQHIPFFKALYNFSNYAFHGTLKHLMK